MLKKLAFLVPILLLCASSSWGACSNTSLGNTITCVQHTGGNECSTVSSCGANAFAQPTTSSNFLRIDVGWTTTGGVTFTCSTGLSINAGSATFVQGATKLGTVFSMTICYAENITGGATPVVTASVAGGTPSLIDIDVFELSGIKTSSVDLTLTAAGSGSSFSIGPTSSTAQVNEYAACMVVNNGSGVPINTPTNSFVIEYSNVAVHASNLDKGLSGTTGTVTCGATMAGSVAEWDALIVTFKATNPGGPVVRKRAQVINQ